jgi:vitamin B12 transporter
MSYRSLALIALPLLVLVAEPARAQQFAPQPLPDGAFGSEITVTATGVESEVAEVPVATTVITREQMDDAQSASVSDLLRRVPGVTVVQSGDAGSLTSLFTRGTNSNHTLVLLDGVRLNSAYFGGYDWSLPTTTALERVEVVRGPFSALWGSDAVGGVVNLISERRRDGFGGRLLAEGGEEGWERFEATVGFASKAFDIQASGYQRTNDGVLDNGDATGEQGLATAGFSWGSGSRLGVVYQDLRSEIGIPFVSPGSPTPDRRQDTDQQLIAIPLTWTLSRSWTLDVVASRVEREIDFSDPDDPWGNVFSTTLADTDQARLASHHRIADHAVTWGGEWRSDTVSDLGPFGPTLDEAETETLSAFAQESWQISPDFRVLAGLRWDDTDSFGSTTTGRLQLGWRLADTVELRGGWGEAFRAPGLGELYGPFGGNPELDAETSESAEVGLVVAPLDGQSRWQLNVFTTDIDNLVEFDFAAMQNANVGHAEIKGAELVWEQGRLDEVRWYLQAAYLDTEGDDGLPLLRRPEWSASWTLNGELSRKWSGDVTVRWVDRRDDVDPLTYERVESPSYTTVDLAIAWKPWGSLAITGRALNVLDEEYEEVAGYPAPGRRFYAGLRWDL